MAERLTITVDSVLRLPDLTKDLKRELKREFKYNNPDFYKKEALGFATWDTPRQIKTYLEDKQTKNLVLPRGGINKLRRVCKDYGYKLHFVDDRTTCPMQFPQFVVSPDHPERELRWYQNEAVSAALRRQQGIVRAPTGSGKSVSALAFIYQAGQRALVIMRDRNLLEQWYKNVQSCLGLSKDQIAIVRGGKKYKPGLPITLAMQQSLYSKTKSNALSTLLHDDPFGVVVVDEAQTLAAKTFQDVVVHFPSKYRIGFSADERRKDKKEFLIYDSMGEIIHETTRQELEKESFIVPVRIRVIPSDFEAQWYREAEPSDRSFQTLLEEMTTDEGRNSLIVDTVRRIINEGDNPSIIFTHRREHARHIAVDRLQVESDVRCGLLLGGSGADHDRFKLDIKGLISNKIDCAAATYQSFGVGHDIPSLRSGVLATPVRNKQFFNQVRGRFCRAIEGKSEGVLYYIWDKEVFPDQVASLRQWNDNRVEILSRRDGRLSWT